MPELSEDRSAVTAQEAPAPKASPQEVTAPEATTEVSAQEVQEWLRGCVAEYVRIPAEDIRLDLPLSEYGLDSVYVLNLSAEVEDHYGVEIPSSLLWDHPALGPLAEALVPLISATTVH